MIAQIVFDLPVDGPFDYLIPEHLAGKVVAGMRVKVSFGPRAQIGFVTGILEESAIAKLKPVLSLCDASAIFNELDLQFAKGFCAYYGCSLGEALFTVLRSREDFKPSIRRKAEPILSLFKCQPTHYPDKIKKIIAGYPPQSRFLILVPDAFRALTLVEELKGVGLIKMGMRSSAFEADGQYACVVMVDDEDSSYKQEQTPMYETRQVLLARAGIYGFDIAFMGISPSVELMEMTRENKVKLIEDPAPLAPAVRLVDLTNYKFVPGLISPPVRDALDAVLKAGKKGLLVLNRRGSYRLTRCVDCAEILKCSHCDSSLIYSRSEGKFLCRYCTYTAPGDTVCPKCRKANWRSMGIGVEQVQAELKKLFPQARVFAFERTGRVLKKSAAAGNEVMKQSLPDFDILIATSAVLRFQASLKVQLAAFIDFDAELNRLEMRSAFNAFSLALHISSMANENLFIQTRNIKHYVLDHLSRGDTRGYYDEELKLRKEFGFAPFKHWVKISWRGKLEKLTYEAAQEAYNVLRDSLSKNFAFTPPLADAIGRKRDQFRFNVMAQANDVSGLVGYIKTGLAQIKRRSKVIVTLNIDP